MRQGVAGGFRREFFRAASLAAILLASSVPSARAEGRALVMVYPFSSFDPRIGATLTEAIKVGITSTGFFSVAEPRESLARGAAGEDAEALGESLPADFSLEGSVEEGGQGLVVAYRLFEKGTGRVIEASTASIRPATIEQDAAAVAAGIGNVMLATYAGANARNVELLIELRRYDEAESRLKALAAREPGNGAIPGLEARIAKGRAELWAAKSEAEVAAAMKAKGPAARDAALDARSSIEAALLSAPAGPAGDKLRESFRRTLEGEVQKALARGDAEYRKDVYQRAKKALSSGQAAAAIQILDDFQETEGQGSLDRKLVDLRGAAVSRRAGDLAEEAKARADEGDFALASSLLGEAAGLDPGSKAVASAADRVGRARARRLAAESTAQVLEYQGKPDLVFAWTGSAGLGMAGFECGDLRLPLAGAVPGLELSAGKYFRGSSGFGGAWRGSLFLGGGSQNVVIRSFPGSLDSAMLVGDAGVEVFFGSKSRAKASIDLGASLDVGALAATYRATYEESGIGSGDRGYALAPSLRLGAFVDYYVSPSLAARFALGASEALLYGFGPAGGIRLSLSIRRVPR